MAFENIVKVGNFEKNKKEELPIKKFEKEVTDLFENDQSILIGETGSGKTTEAPLILAKITEGKIAVTQPRRIAATSVAEYVASKDGSEVGDKIGYQVRFDNKTTQKTASTEGTKLNFMTDGILLAKLQNDPLLSEYSAVMVDEAHERSLNIDICLGLLKRAQKDRAQAGLEPLKIVVASATLEKEKFQKYFSTDGKAAASLEVPGRLFDVKKSYSKESNNNPIELAGSTVQKIVEENKDGDILIFMPGQREIEMTIKQIEKLKLSGIACLPLHGQISLDEQKKVFGHIQGRKIVVATNIAETSVTVPGIKHVIDSGLINQNEFDPQTGISSLLTKKHSLSGLKQRAGRAGRIEAGSYYGLYSEATLKDRPEYTKPEILRSDLSNVILTMKSMGIKDIENFDFIDKPDSEAIKNTLNTLKSLGALDDEEKITKAGELMAQLPLEPHLGRMIVEAQKYNNVETICTVAAFLGLKPVFRRPPQDKPEEVQKAKQEQAKFIDSKSDFLTLLKVWKMFELNNYSEKWARDNFLDIRTLQEVRAIRFQLFQVLRRHGVRATEELNPEKIGKSILSGLVDNLLAYNSHNAYKRIKDDSRGIYIHPGSALFYEKPDMMASAEIKTTGKTYAIMNMVVENSWIKEVAPQLINERLYNTSYDASRDEIIDTIIISLKNNGEIDREDRINNSEKALEVFAEQLIRNRFNLPYEEKNQVVIEQFNNLYIKSGGTISTNNYSQRDLLNFYSERIKDKNIRSKKQLEVALADEKEPLNLELNLTDLVSLDDQSKIEKDNPESVELNDKKYNITYKKEYEKFLAIIDVKDDIFNFSAIPILASGRPLIFKTYDYSSQNYDLDQLKKIAKKNIISQAWKSLPDPEIIQISEFNLLGELPVYPEKIKYTIDPENGQDVYAYPAIITTYNYNQGNYQYQIKYFGTQEEAYVSEDTILAKMKNAKIENARNFEKNLLLIPATELFNKANKEVAFATQNYINCGISYEVKRLLENNMYYAERKLSEDPREAMRLLHEIMPIIEKTRNFAEEKKIEEEKVAEFLNENLKKNCPLCGNSMNNGSCNHYEHDIELIDFGYDEDGEEKAQVILKQVLANYDDKSEKIVADLMVSSGGSRYYNQGYVYTYEGSDLNRVYSADQIYAGYEGKPFRELIIRDYNLLITPSEKENRGRKRAEIERMKQEKDDKEHYEDDLAYAEQQVDNGEWFQAKFRKGINPKTGNEQWEIVKKFSGFTEIFLVDHKSYQPKDEKKEYYFSKETFLSDNKYFRTVLVNIENPFPEHNPNLSLDVSNSVKKAKLKEEPELSSDDIAAALEKFGNFGTVKISKKK